MKTENPLWVIEFKKSDFPPEAGPPPIHFFVPKNEDHTPLQVINNSPPLKAVSSSPPLDPNIIENADNQLANDLIDQLHNFFIQLLKTSQQLPDNRNEGEILKDDLNKSLENLQQWMNEFKKFTEQDDEIK